MAKTLVNQGVQRFLSTNSRNPYLVSFSAVSNFITQQVYCESQGAINALDAQSGEELWKFIAPDPDWWFFNPSLWKLQLVNIFSKLTVGFSLIRFSSPVISNGIVYVLCRNGYLYALH